MLPFLLAIPTVLVGLFCLWPILSRILSPISIGRSGVLAATFGLSTGTLSLYMLTLGLLPGGQLQSNLVIPAPWIIFITGLILTKTYIVLPRIKLNTITFWLSIICISGFVIILINAFLYPFYRYDVLARFAPNARLLFENSAIPNSLTGYPLAIQMLYCFAFMSINAVNDHLAGLVVAGYSGTMILTTFAIARLIFSKRAGWAAVILLLSSHMFVDWSTSGYVDVPVGVYHGLCFLFAFIWMQTGGQRWALIAGIMAGLALWTKQSALVLLPALGIVPLLRIRTGSSAMTETRNSLTVFGSVLLIAGPWYLRSLIIAGPGAVIPAPGAYDAQYINNSVYQLATFISSTEEWGIWLGTSIVFGLTLCSIHFWKPEVDNVSHKSIERMSRSWLLAAFVIPYHIIWWQNFSYDTRYLLSSMPIYAAIAGHGIDWALNRIPYTFSRQTLITIVLAIALVLSGSVGRLGAVYNLMIHPLQTDDEKLERLSAESWALVKHIRSIIQPGSKIYAMDGALAYWLHDYEFKQGYPFVLNDLLGHEYLVTSPTADLVYEFYDITNNEVVRSLGDIDVLPLFYQHTDKIAVYQIGELEH